MTDSTHTQFSERHRGFTLAELVFAAGISVFVITISLGLLMTMLRSEAENYNKISMDQEAKNFLISFNRDVQASGDVLFADSTSIELELLRYADEGAYVERVTYTRKQIEGSNDYYIERELTDATGTLISTQEFFKLDGNQGSIGMIKENATIKNTEVQYATTFYDRLREATDDLAEVRFIRWEFPLFYEASNMTFSRTVATPLTMLRNKT